VRTKVQYIPILEPRSVIVVDNASYYNINVRDQPTPKSIKMDTLTWLDKRDARCRAEMTKVDLYKLIKLYNP
jgi:hypothetical protein